MSRLQTLNKNTERYIIAVLSETSARVTGIFGFILATILPAIPWLHKYSQTSFRLGLTILVTGFIISHFSVIIKLLKQNDFLKDKVSDLEKNIAGFDVEFSLSEVDYGEVITHITNELKWAEVQLKQMEQVSSATYGGSINIKFLERQLAGLLGASKEDMVKYRADLQAHYKLLSYLNNHKVCTIRIWITNTGNNYDEAIVARISCAHVVFKYDDDGFLNKLEDTPERPSSAIEKLGRFPDMKSLHGFGIPSTQSDSGTRIIDTHGLEASISALHTLDKGQIDSKDIRVLFKKEAQKLSFDVVIKSKNTKAVVKRTVVISLLP